MKIEKVETIPEGLCCKSGRRMSPEGRAVDNMAVGEVLKIELDGDYEAKKALSVVQGLAKRRPRKEFVVKKDRRVLFVERRK